MSAKERIEEGSPAKSKVPQKFGIAESNERIRRMLMLRGSAQQDDRQNPSATGNNNDRDVPKWAQPTRMQYAMRSKGDHSSGEKSEEPTHPTFACSGAPDYTQPALAHHAAMSRQHRTIREETNALVVPLQTGSDPLPNFEYRTVLDAVAVDCYPRDHLQRLLKAQKQRRNWSSRTKVSVGNDAEQPSTTHDGVDHLEKGEQNQAALGPERNRLSLAATTRVPVPDEHRHKSQHESDTKTKGYDSEERKGGMVAMMRGMKRVQPEMSSQHTEAYVDGKHVRRTAAGAIDIPDDDNNVSEDEEERRGGQKNEIRPGKGFGANEDVRAPSFKLSSPPTTRGQLECGVQEARLQTTRETTKMEATVQLPNSVGLEQTAGYAGVHRLVRRRCMEDLDRDRERTDHRGSEASRIAPKKKPLETMENQTLRAGWAGEQQQPNLLQQEIERLLLHETATGRHPQLPRNDQCVLKPLPAMALGVSGTGATVCRDAKSEGEQRRHPQEQENQRAIERLAGFRQRYARLSHAAATTGRQDGVAECVSARFVGLEATALQEGPGLFARGEQQRLTAMLEQGDQLTRGAFATRPYSRETIDQFLLRCEAASAGRKDAAPTVSDMLHQTTESISPREEEKRQLALLEQENQLTRGALAPRHRGQEADNELLFLLAAATATSRHDGTSSTSISAGPNAPAIGPLHRVVIEQIKNQLRREALASRQHPPEEASMLRSTAGLPQQGEEQHRIFLERETQMMREELARLQRHQNNQLLRPPQAAVAGGQSQNDATPSISLGLGETVTGDLGRLSSTEGGERQQMRRQRADNLLPEALSTRQRQRVGGQLALQQIAAGQGQRQGEAGMIPESAIGRLETARLAGDQPKELLSYEQKFLQEQQLNRLLHLQLSELRKRSKSKDKIEKRKMDTVTLENARLEEQVCVLQRRVAEQREALKKAQKLMTHAFSNSDGTSVKDLNSSLACKGSVSGSSPSAEELSAQRKDLLERQIGLGKRFREVVNEHGAAIVKRRDMKKKIEYQTAEVKRRRLETSALEGRLKVSRFGLQDCGESSSRLEASLQEALATSKRLAGSLQVLESANQLLLQQWKERGLDSQESASPCTAKLPQPSVLLQRQLLEASDPPVLPGNADEPTVCAEV